MWRVSLLGCGPSSVRAFGPATFPVGEGDLRRGSIHRGSALTFRGPLHTRPGLPPPEEDDWVSAFVPISPARKVGGGCGHPPLRGWKGAKAPCALRHRGQTMFSSRNPGSFLPGWGAAASGWPCFRSGGSALSSRRRSGPPLPGCGSGRRTYRSASAARRLPAR